jgi:hypothetical protein
VATAPDLALQAGGQLVKACIGLAVPGRPIGPWSRRTGAPEASATGRDRKSCRAVCNGLRTVQCHRGRVSSCGRAGSRRRQVEASPSSPAVPPACHKQRARAVTSGQSQSLRGGRWAGRTPSPGWGGGRNCMACKRSRSQVIVGSPVAAATATLRPPPSCYLLDLASEETPI